MANTTVNASYKTGGNNNVILKMNIGFGQPSNTSCFLDGNIILETKDSNIVFELKTTGVVLKNKVLRVRCIIQDKQEITDESSVDFFLTGGEKDFNSSLDNKITPSNGFIAYTYRILFT